LIAVTLLKDVLIPPYTVIPDPNVSHLLAILQLVVKMKKFIVMIMMHAQRMSAMLPAVVLILLLTAMITMPVLMTDVIP
jgi:hypothetical protein